MSIVIINQEGAFAMGVTIKAKDPVTCEWMSLRSLADYLETSENVQEQIIANHRNAFLELLRGSPDVEPWRVGALDKLFSSQCVGNDTLVDAALNILDGAKSEEEALEIVNEAIEKAKEPSPTDYGDNFLDAPYVVIDLSGGASAASYPVSRMDSPPSDGFNTDEYKTTKLVLRRISAGTFMMGSPYVFVRKRCGDEDPHQVTISKPFYIGVFEVTQRQWELVMGNNPSHYLGDMRPVERVSYNMIRGSSSGAGWPASADVDSTSFLGQLRARAAATGLLWDLPTEAMWEYACRAGTTTDLNSGKNTTFNPHQDDNMDEVGRYAYNSGCHPGDGGTKDGKGGYSDHHTTVGSYLPNNWGLYDMHGNVWEWVLDWFQADLGHDAVTDPTGPGSMFSNRAQRGGSFVCRARRCRSAARGHSDPSVKSSDCGLRFAAFTGLQ